MEMRMDSTVSVEREHKKRGFTLTEIAIVLGIIGLILGAIWVAAAAVYTNMRVARSSQELLQITQAVRSLYSTATVTGAGADHTSMTTALIPAGVFPTDSLPNGAASTIVNSPWNGSFINIYTDSVTTAGTGDAFTVAFEGVPSQGCINLAVSSSGSGRDPGLIGVGFATTSWNSTDATPTPAGTATTSATFFQLTGAVGGVPVTTAAVDCGTATSTTVAFTFRLRV